jgi:hypothetical protein
MALWFRFWRAGFILLVLCGTLTHEAIGASDDHRQDRESAPTHCCVICHAGHMAVLQTAIAVAVNGPAITGWCAALPVFAEVREPLVIFKAPRGPPV